MEILATVIAVVAVSALVVGLGLTCRWCWRRAMSVSWWAD